MHSFQDPNTGVPMTATFFRGRLSVVVECEEGYGEESTRLAEAWGKKVSGRFASEAEGLAHLRRLGADVG